MDEQSLHTDTVHDWITGYLTNSLTPEEMQSFQEWLNASEENRKYFSDIQEVWIYNPQIQISAESETKRSIFREKDKTKRSKKESAQHSKSRNKSFVMTSVSAL